MAEYLSTKCKLALMTAPAGFGKITLFVFWPKALTALITEIAIRMDPPILSLNDHQFSKNGKILCNPYQKPNQAN